MRVTFCLGNMVLLSVMPINPLGIENRFGNRKGEKGMERMKKNRQGKESQKEREAGPVTVCHSNR